MSKLPGSVLPSAASIRTDGLFENYVNSKNKAGTSGDPADRRAADRAWREFLESFQGEDAA